MDRHKKIDLSKSSMTHDFPALIMDEFVESPWVIWTWETWQERHLRPWLDIFVQQEHPDEGPRKL